MDTNGHHVDDAEKGVDTAQVSTGQGGAHGGHGHGAGGEVSSGHLVVILNCSLNK